MFNQLGHIAEKEREQERTDMGTVHVGIRHDDDLMIADFIKVKILTDAGSECCNNRLEFLIAHHLVKPSLFDVQHLSPQRQNRLCFTVAPLFCGTAGRITLYNIDLTFFRVFRRTIRELSRKSKAVKAAFPTSCFLCSPCCNTGRCFTNRFFKNFIDFSWILFKKDR